MKKIESIIEKGKDGTYTIFCENEMFSGVGNTAEDAKKDMLKQMKFFKSTAIEDGFSYPKFLDDEFEIVYKFDAASLLEYYSGILSLSGMEKITGIHQKQLWSYLHGKSKPRKPQVVKIENGLHQLGQEFLSISL
jgi:predicted RNase H-like HicB family nuclease